jgi:hypothetical protein
VVLTKDFAPALQPFAIPGIPTKVVGVFRALRKRRTEQNLRKRARFFWKKLTSKVVHFFIFQKMLSTIVALTTLASLTQSCDDSDNEDVLTNAQRVAPTVGSRKRKKPAPPPVVDDTEYKVRSLTKISDDWVEVNYVGFERPEYEKSEFLRLQGISQQLLSYIDYNPGVSVRLDTWYDVAKYRWVGKGEGTHFLVWRWTEWGKLSTSYTIEHDLSWLPQQPSKDGSEHLVAGARVRGVSPVKAQLRHDHPYPLEYHDTLEESVRCSDEAELAPGVLLSEYQFRGDFCAPFAMGIAVVLVTGQRVTVDTSKPSLKEQVRVLHGTVVNNLSKVKGKQVLASIEAATEGVFVVQNGKHCFVIDMNTSMVYDTDPAITHPVPLSEYRDSLEVSDTAYTLAYRVNPRRRSV